MGPGETSLVLLRLRRSSPPGDALRGFRTRPPLNAEGLLTAPDMEKETVTQVQELQSPRQDNGLPS